MATQSILPEHFGTVLAETTAQSPSVLYPPHTVLGEDGASGSCSVCRFLASIVTAFDPALNQTRLQPAAGSGDVDGPADFAVMLLTRANGIERRYAPDDDAVKALATQRIGCWYLPKGAPVPEQVEIAYGFWVDGEMQSWSHVVYPT